MTVTDSITAVKPNGQTGFSVLTFQPGIAQNRAIAFRRQSFESNHRMHIAIFLWEIRNSDAQSRMPDAAALVHFDLRRDAFFEPFNMADNTDHLAAGVQRVERIEGDVQRVTVK